MNWAGIFVTFGLLAVAVFTMPYGLALLALLAVVWWKS